MLPDKAIAISVATADDRPGWYYVVDGSEDAIEFWRAVPGVVHDVRKRRLLVHYNVVASNPNVQVVYVNPREVPPQFGLAQPNIANVVHNVLRPYQRDFVTYSLERTGVLNADDVGTGKTIQALSAVAGAGIEPVLVVGTLLTKSVWCGPKSEPMKWYGIDVIPLETRKNAGPEPFQNQPSRWFFCHYDILEAWLPFICAFLRPRAVVFDEAHNASPKTKRGRAASSIARFKEIRKRVVLSATPIRNKRIDLWSVLDLAAPDGFGDRHSFGAYFCGGVQGEYGWVYTGETHNEELKARLREVMMRRTKAEIMTQLPPLTRQCVDVELSKTAADEYTKYREAERDIRKFLEKIGTPLAPGISGERLVQLTKMLSILSHGKAETTVNLAIETANAAGKVVAFCWFKDVAERIAKDVRAAGVKVFGPINGEHGINKRIEAATQFAECDEPCAFVATMAAASESINQLAAAQHLVINDLYWKPLVLIQTEGRLHRGGQKGAAVHVYYPIAQNTIDTLLLEALYRKADAGDAVGIRDDTKDIVRTMGGAAPTDDLAAFVAAVEKSIETGGYGYDG